MISGILGICLFGMVAVGGSPLFGKWLKGLDTAARVGVGGLLALATYGMTIFATGLIGGLKLSPALAILMTVAGIVVTIKTKYRPLPVFQGPKGLDVVPFALATLAMLLALAGVFSPSTPLDWDSLAYHLAVPKIWLETGKITFISYIHHSNFPGTVDMLFIPGLIVGGQFAAKAAIWLITVFGAISIFGLARERYGVSAGWWSAATFCTIPMVMWESGTAYIDVAHGLFAGLGTWLLIQGLDKADRDRAILGGLLLGFALGSKYTGIQTLGIATIAGFLAWRGSERKSGLKDLAIPIGLAVLVALPWYIKNIVMTGNPVYPFFYSLLGGKNWDAFHSMIYTEEQKTFGIGASPLQPMSLGIALFGLALAPGRFTNPQPTLGNGFLFVSLGAVVMVGLVWLVLQTGRAANHVQKGSGSVGMERKLALAVGLTLLAWFALSQQSRYILAIAPIACIAFGSAVSHAKLGNLFKGIAVVNGFLALGIIWTMWVTPKMPYLSGGLTEEEYVGGFADNAGNRVPGQVGFYQPAKKLNEVAKSGKVALYDEVFGFFLDVPYIWASPGHTTEFGYAEMKTADDLIASLKKMGVTHVYLNLSIYPASPEVVRWFEAMGFGPMISRDADSTPKPFTAEEKSGPAFEDIRTKWRFLMADAIGEGKLRPVESFGKRVILEVVP